MASPNRKIAVFIPSLHGGGAERAMLMFCRELIQLGLDVDLVTVRLEGPLRELIPPEVSVVNLNCRRTSYALPKLVSYLRRTKPAALYATIMNANVIAAMAARLAGRKTPTIVRESNAPLSSPKKTFGRWLTYNVSPYLYQCATGVIAVSQGVADELTVMAPRMASKIRVAPTPVISDDVIAQGDVLVDHPWFIEHDKPIIITAARLEPHKGHLALLHAFAIARKKRNARLVILGEGTLEERMRREIALLGLQDHVAMLGFAKNPFAYISKADVFVLASEFEGLPNVLVQAMAFGTPIVSTDCKSGPAEILCGGRFGTLVPVGDVGALAAGIEHAVTLPRQHDGMAYARRRYGARNAAVEYLAMAGLVV
jgi:glycosyltransferase involved in cell wall biosynthesis